mgnify:CR=1 FL=1
MEFRQRGSPPGANPVNFPVFSLRIRERTPETSSHPTPHTAIQSACAETFGLPRRSDREVSAIPRGSALAGSLK